jgi:hypothetical protein
MEIKTTKPAEHGDRYHTDPEQRPVFLKHGDRVKIEHDGHTLFGKVGTLAGYALECYECPLESIARAKRNGHDTNPWVNQDCGMITSDVEYNRARREQQDNGEPLAEGTRVWIEGRTGTVQVNGNYSDMARIVLDQPI